ncbi:MAG: hypothetical protein ACJ8F3_17705 [Xanthobacteraceae bacterium]
MSTRKGAGLASAATDNEAQKVYNGIGSAQSSKPPFRNPQLPLYGELTGDDTCAVVNITAKGNAPVLALCRQLLAQGVSPDAAAEIFRNGTLALRIRSIGQAAGLEINSRGTGFTERSARVRTASLVGKSRSAVAHPIPSSKTGSETSTFPGSEMDGGRP